MKYKFKWKRRFFWRSEKSAVGHMLNVELDRMDVHLASGGILSIPRWSECTLFLGVDWVLATKNRMEEEAGQEIKLKAGVGE